MENTQTYSKFRWFWLWTITFSYMVVGMSIVFPAAFIGDMAKAMGLPVATVSFAGMAVFSLANAVGTILGGPILDKYGVSKTITIGALITLLSYLLIPVFDSYTGLMILRVIMGLSTGPVVGCVSIIALKWFPKSERAIYSGFQGSGIAIGIFLCFAIIPGVFYGLTGMSWQKTFLIGSIAPLIALISCFITNFVKPTTQLPAYADHSADFKNAMRSPYFYMTIAIIFTSLWAMDAFNDLTPGYMAVPAPMGLGFGGAMSGQSMTLVSLGIIIGSLLSGFFVKFLFNNRVKPIILISFLGCAIFSVSVAFPAVYNNRSLLLTCLFLQGFFQSFAVPQMALYVAQSFSVTVAGRVYGAAMGIGVFGSVGVTVGAFLLHATGTYHASIYAVGIVCLVGLVVSYFLSTPQDREAPQIKAAH
jgi:MFS family permease